MAAVDDPTAGIEAVALDDDVVALLKKPSFAHVSTLMKNGSPAVSMTWIDTDGHDVLVNTVEHYAKTKHMRREPRVAISVNDPDVPARYVALRGVVVAFETEGAFEHIEMLSQLHWGIPYPLHANGARVIARIRPTRVINMLTVPDPGAFAKKD